MALSVPRLETKDITVTVASGSGSTLFFMTGRIDKIALTAPIAGDDAVVSVDITDASSNGIWGMANIPVSAGRATIEIAKKLCVKSNTITLSSATQDGDWSVRLWIEYGQ